MATRYKVSVRGSKVKKKQIPMLQALSTLGLQHEEVLEILSANSKRREEISHFIAITHTPPDSRSKSGEFSDLAYIVSRLLGDRERVRGWVRDNNKVFGKPPIDMLREGRSQEVLSTLYAVAGGTPK